jgi:hypothetical protein
MARIIVTTDPIHEHRAATLRDQTPVLLDERVNSAHLCDDHSAGQLIERVAWAVADAEEAEHAVTAGS